MTISNPTSVAGPFLTDGVATVFPFGFAVGSASEIQVTVINNLTGVSFVIGGYTVTLSGEGGSLNFGSDPPDPGYSLFIEGNPDFTQGVTSDTSIMPGVISGSLDLSVIRDLYLKNITGRAIIAPPGETGIALPAAAVRANRVLAFASDGTVNTLDPGFVTNKANADLSNVAGAPLLARSLYQATDRDMTTAVNLGLRTGRTVILDDHAPNIVSAPLIMTPGSALRGNSHHTTTIVRNGNFGSTVVARGTDGAVGGAPAGIFLHAGIYDLTFQDGDGTMAAGVHMDFDFAAFITLQNIGIISGRNGINLLGAASVTFAGDFNWRVSDGLSPTGRSMIRIGPTTCVNPFSLHGGDIHMESASFNLYSGTQQSNACMDDIIRVETVDGLYLGNTPHGIFYQKAGLHFLIDGVNPISNVYGTWEGDYGNGPAVLAEYAPANTSQTGYMQFVQVEAKNPAQEPVVTCTMDDNSWIRRKLGVAKANVALVTGSANIPAAGDSYQAITMPDALPGDVVTASLAGASGGLIGPFGQALTGQVQAIFANSSGIALPPPTGKIILEATRYY